MQSKTINHLLAAATAAVLSFTSCVKDELHDTPHPGYGKLSVTADWTNLGANVPVPDTWTVTLGDYTGSETGATHTPDRLFLPGDYSLVVYNTPEGITVSGTVATVDAVPGNGGETFIDNMPGWLMTGMQGVVVEQDRDNAFSAAATRQVRELTIVVEQVGDAVDRIAGIDACLSGVAGTLDFVSGTYGKPSDVQLVFAKIEEGADAGKWTATVRMLGTAGTVQHLKGVVRYAGDNPPPAAFDSDLSAALEGFNADKREPLTVGCRLQETASGLTIEAGVDGWTPGNGDGQDGEAW